MKHKITVLQFFPSRQVTKERQYEIKDGYITFPDRTSYRLRPECIFMRGMQPYAILLTGTGFIPASCFRTARNFGGLMC